MIGLEMRVTAAEERDFIEHAFLKPLQGEVDHWGDIKRYELRDDLP